MFGKIYLKLYFWFVLIFVVTLLVVTLLVSNFYGSNIHAEIENQLISYSRFLLSEYQESCAGAAGSSECRAFLDRLQRLPQLRFWVLDPSGRVRFPKDLHPPDLNRRDIQRAASGEVVTAFFRRTPVKLILPFHDHSGHPQLLVVERAPLVAKKLPRFPLMATLVIAGAVIALLVLPLSRRLTRPIRELHQLGEEWAGGQLEKRATVHGSDEIADLAKVFNTMAENLEKMLQQRKEFLALISHELKSPLARMRVALELLSDPKTDHVKLIKDLENEIDQSHELIEQLLVLSRIEMAPPGIKEPVDLGFLIQKSVEQLEPAARNSGVSIVTEMESATINGNPTQLQSAIGNILENAVKFAPSGSKVTIVLQRTDRLIRVQCKDEGPGILPEEQEKVFEPFFRGRTATGKEGSGLGLFIARRIIEMHKGTIRAVKNHPAGTNIMIELPA